MSTNQSVVIPNTLYLKLVSVLYYNVNHAKPYGTLKIKALLCSQNGYPQTMLGKFKDSTFNGLKNEGR